MRNAFIIHGTGWHSQENWFPWLQAKLEDIGISTSVPDFWVWIPNVDDWQKIFEKYVWDITEETLLIWHSLWGAFLLRLLENYQWKIHLLVTVGSPVWIQPIRFYESDFAFLHGFDFEWESIVNKVQHSLVFHSDDDPYVSLWNGQELAKKLGTKLSFIPNSWHFNEAAWFTEFPQLLEEIKKII